MFLAEKKMNTEERRNVIHKRKQIEINERIIIKKLYFFRPKKPTVKIKENAKSPQSVEYKYFLDIHK